MAVTAVRWNVWGQAWRGGQAGAGGVRDKGALQTASEGQVHTGRPHGGAGTRSKEQQPNMACCVQPSAPGEQHCSGRVAKWAGAPAANPLQVATSQKTAPSAAAAAPSTWLAAAGPALWYWVHSRGSTPLLGLPFVQGPYPARTLRTFSTCVGLWKMNFARGASPLMVAPLWADTRHPEEDADAIGA